MTWAAKMEHVPLEDIDSWKQAAEKDADKRMIRCEVDPEHPDYMLCSYEERLAKSG